MHQVDLLDGVRRASEVLRPQPAQPSTERGVLLRAGVVAAQPPLVDPFGDEAADVGVHPSGLGEEHTAVLRHGHRVAEQVLERASAARCRVRRQGDLRKLQRVAEQQEVTRRPARGKRVSERQLARLVHDEDIDGLPRQVVAREGPRRAGDQRVRGVSGRLVAGHVGDLAGRPRCWAPLLHGVQVPQIAQVPVEHDHRFEQVVDGVVAEGGDADPLA